MEKQNPQTPEPATAVESTSNQPPDEPDPCYDCSGARRVEAAAPEKSASAAAPKTDAPDFLYDPASPEARLIDLFNRVFSGIWEDLTAAEKARLQDLLDSALRVNPLNIFNPPRGRSRESVLLNNGTLPVGLLIFNLESAHNRRPALEVLYAELSRALQAILRITGRRLSHAANHGLETSAKALGVSADAYDPLNVRQNPNLVSYP